MKLKSVIDKILKVVVLSLMLSACGEPFRATLSTGSDLTGESQGGSRWFDENGNRRTNDTEVNSDQAAISQYWDEIQGNQNRSEAINNMIEAFDLIASPAENNRIRLTARLVLSCNNAGSFQRTVENVNMQPGLIIEYGRQGDFELESQCTTQRCDEMMVAVRKVAGSNRGVLLIPLGVGGTADGQIVYVPRNITRTAYFGDFEFDHVGEFEAENSCRIRSGNSSDSLTDRLIDRGKEIIRDELVEQGQDLLEDWFDGIF